MVAVQPRAPGGFRAARSPPATAPASSPRFPTASSRPAAGRRLRTPRPGTTAWACSSCPPTTTTGPLRAHPRRSSFGGRPARAGLAGRPHGQRLAGGHRPGQPAGDPPGVHRPGSRHPRGRRLPSASSLSSGAWRRSGCPGRCCPAGATSTSPASPAARWSTRACSARTSWAPSIRPRGGGLCRGPGHGPLPLLHQTPSPAGPAPTPTATSPQRRDQYSPRQRELDGGTPAAVLLAHLRRRPAEGPAG